MYNSKVIKAYKIVYVLCARETETDLERGDKGKLNKLNAKEVEVEVERVFRGMHWLQLANIRFRV
jgi:hypothetical protein